MFFYNKILSFLGIVFFFTVLSSSAAYAGSRYDFDSGSIHRPSYPSDYKIKQPVLTIHNERGESKLNFPLGAEIYKDKSDDGYLLVKFPDKRFAAFLTFGIDLVDLKRSKKIPVVRGVVYEVDSKRDDAIITVRRIPLKGEMFVKSGINYNDNVKVLSVTKLDYSIGRFWSVDIISGAHLPDINHIEFDNETEIERIRKKFHVDGGTLFYALDRDGKTVHEYVFAEQQDNDAGKQAYFWSIEPPIVVNYDKLGSKGFLQVSISLMSYDASVLDRINKYALVIRNKILHLLNGRKFENLIGSENRSRLQKEVLDEANRVLKEFSGKGGVDEVYFTSFVIQ